MLTRPSPSPTGPETGLLVSLGAWTWLGTAPDGQQVAHVLLALPPGRHGHDTPEAIEARIRHLAVCLGGLVRAADPVPDLEGRLKIIGSQVLLTFPGARWGLRLPTHPRWAGLVRDAGRAALILGLDPLPQSADARRLDAYLDAAITADRLLFGFAGTT
ncbi:DUF5949 family protein [Streptomyces nojiriensis]|uniref:DUF5949 family protein n=1 Tax=Streptomyces nojiriensis TaxID=66374 RepID=UPI002E16BF17